MSRARLVLEHTPSAQASTDVTYHGGQLVVGRGDEADWRIDDPDKFVSRKHFVLSEDGETIMVTDASTGGLFVDGSSSALGVGNSIPLENEMRLRFGDFVAKVELSGSKEKSATQSQPAESPNSPFSFKFDPVAEAVPEPERPKDLPEPFGTRSSKFFESQEDRAPKPPPPIDRDDPFALELKPAVPDTADTAEQAPDNPGGYFTKPRGEPEVSPPEFTAEEPSATTRARAAEPLPVRHDTDLREAFFRGMGLDPAKFSNDDQVAEMEALGKRFRALTDGVLHLLQTRAEEKLKVRVAQTIIGSANVSPLKNAVSVDDAVSALVAERGAGYLDPDAAVAEAFRDLVDHQLRTWIALQSALRKMIDKFDPEEIEREMDDTGLLEALIAGGRSAKLWQLYEERYQDIASAAEERFLGEIGADFRDAYEKKGKG